MVAVISSRESGIQVIISRAETSPLLKEYERNEADQCVLSITCNIIDFKCRGIVFLSQCKLRKNILLTKDGKDYSRKAQLI